MTTNAGHSARPAPITGHHARPPPVADITAFTRDRIVARYSGTVAELVADFNAGTPDRTVLARPLVGLTTPRTADGR